MSDENNKTESWPSPSSVSRLWKDRYLIEKELARGGFGIVYLARDQQLLSKPVVVKVLLEDMGPDPYIQKKFRQEIEALARIDHPGIVGVLDVGETPEGKPFLVMQFVEGATLRSQIAAGGMSLPQSARIIRQIGQALTAAHEKGVLHRDLKPENIMLQTLGDGEVHTKLIDFGIAAVKDSQVDRAQLTSKIAGTLSYMAPEQVMGNASMASDLYALGVIAFEMVTGVRPENSPQGVAKKPRELRPELNETAQAVILKALSFRPEDRQSRVREFSDGLAEAIGITAPIDLASQARSSGVVPSSAMLEMAYVLFMDLVDYSKLTMEKQTERIQQLQSVVRDTPDFQEASKNSRLISLPTGDGMALVFFQNPVTPVQCATEISRVLRKRPELRLRMGVHTGPVYRIADINANHNVTGGGINLAQRVMDCGDAGHILLSKSFADVLVQLSDWTDSLHDIGEVSVKHGTNVHLVNLYSSNFGNPALPSKVAATRSAASAVQPAPAPPTTAAAPTRKGKSGVLIGVGAAVILAVAGTGLYVASRDKTPEASAPNPPAQIANPAPVVAQPPAPAPATKPEVQPAPKTDAAKETPAPKAVAEEAPVNEPTTPAATPEATAPDTTIRGAAAAAAGPRGNVVGQLRQRVLRLNNRATEAGRGIQSIEIPQNRQGANIRRELTAAREEFQRLMQTAVTALNNRDPQTAAQNLDLADKEIAKVETFIRRGGLRNQ